ncbi:MAG: winged helix-turn-helix domain-containing protein [bacterium]
MEFRLVVALMENQGRVQTRDALLTNIWDKHADIFTRAVDTHVRRLRKKLGEAGELIETIIGLGYRFKQDEDN